VEHQGEAVLHLQASEEEGGQMMEDVRFEAASRDRLFREKRGTCDYYRLNSHRDSSLYVLLGDEPRLYSFPAYLVVSSHGREQLRTEDPFCRVHWVQVWRYYQELRYDSLLNQDRNLLFDETRDVAPQWLVFWAFHEVWNNGPYAAEALRALWLIQARESGDRDMPSGSRPPQSMEEWLGRWDRKDWVPVLYPRALDWWSLYDANGRQYHPNQRSWNSHRHGAWVRFNQEFPSPVHVKHDWPLHFQGVFAEVLKTKAESDWISTWVCAGRDEAARDYIRTVVP